MARCKTRLRQVSLATNLLLEVFCTTYEKRILGRASGFQIFFSLYLSHVLQIYSDTATWVLFRGEWFLPLVFRSKNDRLWFLLNMEYHLFTLSIF